jgi:hypothetical protein
MQLERIMRCGVGVGVMAASWLVTAPAGAEVRAGGVGGIALASLSTNEKGTELGTLTRWCAGGVLELDLSPTLALASRPMYVGRGANIESIPGLGDVSAQGNGSYARTELGYIELPLLLKYSLPTGGTRPYLIAGPSLGLLRTAKAVSRFGSAGEEREDIKKDFESTEISLHAGAGVGADLGRAYVFAEGLYGFGLTNINKDKTEGTGRNRGLQLRAGITVRLGAR